MSAGGVQLAQRPVREPEIEECRVRKRLLLDRAADPGDGFAMLAALVMEHSEQVQRIELGRLQRQNAAITGLGFRDLARLVVGDRGGDGIGDD